MFILGSARRDSLHAESGNGERNWDESILGQWGTKTYEAGYAHLLQA
jgi:hypothetical protein